QALFWLVFCLRLFVLLPQRAFEAVHLFLPKDTYFTSTEVRLMPSTSNSPTPSTDRTIFSSESICPSLSSKENSALIKYRPKASGSFAYFESVIPSFSDELIFFATLSRSTSVPVGRIFARNESRAIFMVLQSCMICTCILLLPLCNFHISKEV